MKRLLIGGAAAAFLIAAASATAQVTPPPGVAQGSAIAPVAPVPPVPQMQKHVMIMTNKVMTRDEVVAHVRKMFGHLDANHDGYITRDEIQSMRGSMMGMRGEMPKQFVLHDGHMPGGGAMPDRGAMFDRLDTNHDQYISRQEFAAGQPLREERVFIMRSGAPGPMRMGGMGTEPGMERGMEPGMHGGFGGHMFEMADTNHDGRVSLAEAQSAALAHFDRADLNHDGRLTPEERQQSRQSMHMQRRPG